MQQRYVGTSGLRVSRLALGTMTWGRDTDEHEARDQLVSFVAAGGTLVDTAAAILTVVVGFLLVGAGVSSIIPLVYSLAGKTGTMSTSSAVTAVATTGYFGFLLGPPLIGWIAGASSLRVSFFVIALMGLTISWLSYAMGKTQTHS